MTDEEIKRVKQLVKLAYYDGFDSGNNHDIMKENQIQPYDKVDCWNRSDVKQAVDEIDAKYVMSDTSLTVIFTIGEHPEWPDCPECEMLKQWCNNHGVKYIEMSYRFIYCHPNHSDINAELSLNNMGLPVVWYKNMAMDSDSFKRNYLSKMVMNNER